MLIFRGHTAFIEELALRAWIEADKHDRKTLGRADVAAALKQTDMYECGSLPYPPSTTAITNLTTNPISFLIDIVPREEGQHEKEKEKKSRPTKRRKTEQDN